MYIFIYIYIYIHTCLYNSIHTSRKPWGVAGGLLSLEMHQRMFHVSIYPDSYDSPRTSVMENAGGANA